MQEIDSQLRERLLVARIDQLQADVKQVEEATKAAQEQAFRSAFVPCPSQCHAAARTQVTVSVCIVYHIYVVVRQAGKGTALRLQGTALRLQEQVLSAA